MRYLLDTHIFVFYAEGGENLDRNTTAILGDYGNRIYVSSEVIKETMHLLRNGKIKVERWKCLNDIWKSIDEWEFVIDYVKREHIWTLGKLVTAKGHKDPTDHIIIAQAITNKMAVISSDGQFKNYRSQGLDLVFNER